MTVATIPLFPLSTVLFPDGPLPLRVFEPRYLDMISNCMKSGSSFGVLQIRSGNDTGNVDVHRVGTLATVIDWYQGSDGILGITALGSCRFHLISMERQRDGLYMGAVEFMQPEAAVPLPVVYKPMAELLRAIIEDLGLLYESLEKHYQDAGWVGCRLAEVLPISGEQKQHCLELNDPLERIETLRPLLRALREDSIQ